MIAEALGMLLPTGAATTIDGAHPRDPVLARWLGRGSKTAAGVDVDERKVLGYPAFFRGVNLLANGVGKLPLNVYRYTRDGKTKAKEHAAYRLLRRKPNRYRTAGVFKRLLTSQPLSWGNGYAYIDRDGGGRPRELIPLLPDRTRPVILRGGGVSLNPADEGKLVYTTRVAGRQHNLLPENVLHIRGLGGDGLVGYSVVDLLKESLGLGMAAREFGARFFGQGATSSGIVTMPSGMEEEAEERFIKSVREGTAGLGKAHLLMVLEEGSTWTATTIAPEAAQFLQTREFEVREVALILGCQPHKLGDPTRKSYNSLEQSNQEHLDDGLDPWLNAWEEECEDKLLSEREKDEETHFIEFNRNAVVRTNLAARTMHYASGRQWGYYSANDIRRMENQDTIGPQGDVYLQPGNMSAAGTLAADERGKGGRGEGGNEEEEDEDLDEDTSRERNLRIAHRGLLVDGLERVARRIAHQATREAAKGARPFCAWLEGMVEANASAALAMLEPALRACGLLLGLDVAPALHRSLLEMVHQDLERLIDTTTVNELPAAVAAVVDRHQAETVQMLADRIIPRKEKP